MNLEQFFSQLPSASSEAFNSRHFNQEVSIEVLEWAHRGLNVKFQ